MANRWSHLPDAEVALLGAALSHLILMMAEGQVPLPIEIIINDLPVVQDMINDAGEIADVPPIPDWIVEDAIKKLKQRAGLERALAGIFGPGRP